MTLTKCFGGLAIAAAGITLAPAAHALPTQYVAILLDGSGSMLSTAFQQTVPGMPAQQPVSKWRAGLDRAMARVAGQKIDQDQLPVTDPNWYVNEEDDLNVPPAVDSMYPPAIHCYAVWVFGGTSNVKVYPPAPQSFQCASTAQGAKDPNVYEAVRTALNTLSPPASPAVTTPLADGLCTVLDETYLQAGAGEFARSVILESDGMENSSTQTLCKGSTAGTFNPDLVNPGQGGQFLKWAGGLPKDSWMYKVYNKAFNNDPAFYPDPDAAPSWPVPSILGLRVDPTRRSFAHFYNEGFGINDLAFARTLARSAVFHVDALYDFIQPGASAATVAAANAAFPDSLRGFLKGLSVHSRGRYQKIQYNANSLPGAAHNPPGDVDDSGCVTNADLNHIRQTDTWMRPSNATPHTRLCDANRDGWINNYDVQVVLPRINQCRPGCTLATQTTCVH